MSGIYCIKNIINKKLYIGSSINISRRIKIHFSKLRNNKHTNSHLQFSYNKYGRDAFIYGVVEYCEPIRTILEKLEQKYIDSNDFKNLYNIYKTAFATPSGKANFDKKRKLYQYDIDGNFIKEWDSCLAACNVYGNGVRSCLNNKLIACKNYFFFYKNSYTEDKLILKLETYNLNRQRRKVAKYDLEDNLITIYDSITICAKIEDNGCLKNISRVCTGGRKSFRSFKYEYV